ncbi:MAG TPA: HAD-IA family hydrolase [Solirubrobacteraceae bacterium]|jgi:HAD superfamily hydrolase (TIGR01509 family)|nr:HAD-IA family hydrolase [Solirubrobacteraceae bacterium]
MGELQLVIFDCDGVLVDSERLSNAVLAEMLSAEGLPTTLEQSRSAYQGLLLDDIGLSAQARLGRRLPDGWLAGYERAREEAFRRALKPVRGAREAVRRIAAAGVPVCVASQGKLEKTQLSLELTGLGDLFAEGAVFSAYMVARGKPHPDLFLHAAAAMGAEPADCAVVEDTPSGVMAAVAAGMRVLGYSADSDESALREAGAELVAAMADVPGLLGIA